MATALAVFAPPGAPGLPALLTLLVALAIAGLASVRAWRDPTSEVAFYAAMLVAAVDVGLICTTHALSAR